MPAAKEKEYLFQYMDRANNELTRKVYTFDNIQQARKHANLLLGNSMQADLYKIRVTLLNY